MNSLVENLQRKVELVDNRFILTTEPVNDAVYACYLYFKGGVEKSRYTKSQSFTFDVHPVPGDYSARFFYKMGGEKISASVFFTVSKDHEIWTVEKRLVVDHPEYSIDYYFNESENTFIVFNGDGSTKGTPPFGLSFLIKLGVNVIAVKQNNNYYQYLSLIDFKNAVSPFLKSKRVFLYGSSLGGYCALYFASVVRGVVIAAAPRNPLHSSISDVTKATGEYRHLKINQSAESGLEVYVVYDPTNFLDRKFFESAVVSTYQNMKVFEVPYAGHEVLMHLNYIGSLKAFISSIITGNLEPSNVSFDKGSPYVDRSLALINLSNHDYKQALYYASRALRHSPKRKLDTKLLKIIDQCVYGLRQ